MIKWKRKQVLLIFLLLVCNFLFANLDKKILILHSYHKGFLWTDDMTAGIESAFDDRSKYEIHHEYLDYKRHNDKLYLEKLSEMFKLKKYDVEFDGIITTDNFALDFALKYRDELGKDIPIVFCGINDYSEEMLVDYEKVTGVVEKPDYRATFDLMLSLHPDTENVLILTDKTPTGRKIKAEILAILPEYFGRVKIEVFEDFYLEEMFTKLKGLSENTIIYTVVINKTIDKSFVSYEIVEGFLKESNIPIYTSWEIYLNKGIIGGKILRGFSQGERAGNMMLKILDGHLPDKMDIETESSGEYIFDAEMLNKFQISFNKLPVNSKIINSSEGFITRNLKLVLVLVLIVILIILVIVLKIFFNKKEELRIENINKSLEKEVKLRTKELEQANEALKRQQDKRIKKAYKDGFVRIKIELLKDITEILIPLEQIIEEEIEYKHIDMKKELDFFETDILANLKDNNNKNLKENLNKIPDLLKGIRYRNSEELKRFKYCEKEISHLKEVVRLDDDASGTMSNDSFLEINKILEKIIKNYPLSDLVKIETSFQFIEKLLLEKSQIERILSDLINNQYEALKQSSYSEKKLFIDTINEENYIIVKIYSKKELYSREFLENIFSLSYITNAKKRKYFELYGCYQTMKKLGGRFEAGYDSELGDVFSVFLAK